MLWNRSIQSVAQYIIKGTEKLTVPIHCIVFVLVVLQLTRYCTFIMIDIHSLVYIYMHAVLRDRAIEAPRISDVFMISLSVLYIKHKQLVSMNYC